MPAYYNEIDPYAAQWLRNLIAAGEIAPGDVDERSIEKVSGNDLAGYTQCHFFAGIGGWSYALRLAGWPDERPVWTGSVPCQPLSCAGQRKGHADRRYLWPAFYRLVSERRPATVFGEQVASKDGREWFAGVRADLGELGYACGAADMQAASVGAPHIRQRLWWVAYSQGEGPPQGGTKASLQSELGESCGEHGGVANAPSEHGGPGTGRNDRQKVGNAGWVGDAAVAGLQDERCEQGAGSEGRFRQLGSPSGNGFWDAASWIPCGDGKARRVEPGIHPLAYGATARVGRLRAYGNAIVPQVAAEFIRAFEEVRSSNRG